MTPDLLIKLRMLSTTWNEAVDLCIDFKVESGEWIVHSGNDLTFSEAKAICLKTSLK